MSVGLYSHTTRATGTVLTAAIYNSDHVNHITNQNPSMTGAYSDSVGQMQTNTDPGAVGTESLAGSLAGELERLRFAIKRLGGAAQWYAAPVTGAFSTSVVTPLVTTSGANSLSLGVNGGSQWRISGTTGDLFPVGDNNTFLGGAANRIAAVVTPVIDSGTTGSLSLKTNNGTTGLEVVHVGGTVVNWFSARGNITTGPAQFIAIGSDANVDALIGTKGSGTTTIRSDVLGTPRTIASFIHNTGANNITFTNGTNPTISTTAGSLAITPAVVLASNLTVNGTLVAATWSVTNVVATGAISVGTTPAVAGGPIRIPYDEWIAARNSANSADILVAKVGSLGGTTDIVFLGGNTANGVILKARTKAGTPTTSDVVDGSWALIRDSSGGTTKLYYNNGGSLQSVALA